MITKLGWARFVSMLAFSIALALVDASLILIVGSYESWLYNTDSLILVMVFMVVRLLLTTTFTYALYRTLAVSMLALDLSMYRKIRTVTYTSFMHYFTVSQATLVPVGFLQVFTLVSDIFFLVFAVFVLSSVNLVITAVFMTIAMVIVIPVVFIFMVYSKRLGAARVSGERHKIDAISFLHQHSDSAFFSGWLGVGLRYTVKRINEWITALFGGLLVNKLQRYYIEFAFVLSILLGYMVIDFLGESMEPAYLVMLGVVGAKVAPIGFRAFKSLIVIVSIMQYVNQFELSLIGYKPRINSIHKVEGLYTNLMRGKINRLVGASGVGKSTLLHDLASRYRSEHAIAYIEQNNFCFLDTVKADSDFFGINHEARVKILRSLKVKDFEHERIFSGGELNRIALSRALSSKASLILVDEPGSGLSGEELMAVYQALALSATKALVVIVSHDTGQGCDCVDHIITR